MLWDSGFPPRFLKENRKDTYGIDSITSPLPTLPLRDLGQHSKNKHLYFFSKTYDYSSQ